MVRASPLTLFLLACLLCHLPTPALGQHELAGVWRRPDGLELDYRKSGDKYVGYIVKLNDAAIGLFKVGEPLATAQLAADGTYVGTGSYRSGSGSEKRPTFKITFKDANNFTTDLGETYTRGAPVPDTSGNLELEGSWSRLSDGHVVRFEKNGENYVGVIVDPGGVASLFKAGERTIEVKRTAPGTYEGRMLYRWSDGRSEWRAEKIVLSDANHFNDGTPWLRAGASQCEKTFAKTWTSNWGQFVIRLEGNRATGTYANREGRHGGGTFSGTVSANTLNGTWRDSAGDGTFNVILADTGCRFDGTYTINSGPGAGTGPQRIGGTDVRMGDPGTSTGSNTGGGPNGPGTGNNGAPPAVTRMTLWAESRRVPVGGRVDLPVWLLRGANVANINVNVTYDPAVARAQGDVLKGNLLGGALFSANPAEAGVARVGFAQRSGVSGSGTIAVIPFIATGQPGTRTPITLAVSTINDSGGASPTIEVIAGEILIVGQDGVLPGDGNGDGRVTELDALLALKMSVRLIESNPSLDLDRDRQVTSRDAVLILQQAVRQ